MTAFIVLTHIAVHQHTTPIKSRNSITCERIHREFKGFTLGMIVREVYVLTC